MNTFNGTELDSLDNIQNNTDLAIDNIGQRVTNIKLMGLRANNPFLQFLPMPNSGFSIQLQPGVSVDINLPSETKFVFPSGDQVYYLSRNGKAQVPGLADAAGNGNYSAASIQNPEGTFLYVEEVQQLSVISPVVCNFTMGFYMQG